ncbi:CBS domain-containing protein [Hanstruepera neustonica]|uniref:CBS domain-containing protein n=1 Tax=Hanstruepera neustonica TaxID=1445657 RepID=A0A2K1E3F2_9FLAO|nr:CBS domain-containing protein [Hanstruepera neustonica]PNQ74824.1 CBS domain-containing protein [Hanstruepera neustonica]
MGNLNVTRLVTREEKSAFIDQLTRDLEALEMMLEKGLIEKEPIRIGAEQEFCVVDRDFFPCNNSLDLLAEIEDNHFTTEIGSFNLEINLDPFELKNDCFSKLHEQLVTLLEKAKAVCDKHDSKIVLTGILPTFSLKHISEDYMTKVQRYQVLNEAIKDSRKQDFSIHIKGTDELNLLHDSVMLEACNTSFQTHLQIHPDNFVDDYNWAQAISGPVLSICANSPLLFGKELWNETRIALFTQSVDTRSNSFLLNEKQSRVSFGSDWETGSVVDIFRDSISRFRSLVTSEYDKDSVDMVESGEIPKLKALSLHNGTVYRWNRVCYGVGDGKPHLRIENRYLPSGPTTSDEIANMMFWVGLMLGKPKSLREIHNKWCFKDVKSNFFNAARYGMGTQFIWDNEYISSHKLLLDILLPMAYKGLYKAGITPKDAEKYLTIIENRIKSHCGSQWMIKSYRVLQNKYKPFAAAQALVAGMYEKQEKDYPVGSWSILDYNSLSDFKTSRKVKHVMSTNIFSVEQSDSLKLVLNIMMWKNIHHMPVINDKQELIGLLSWNDVESYISDENINNITIDSIMRKHIITATEWMTLEEAQSLMTKNKINSLPVLKNNKLIGIVTSKDI